MVRGKKPVTQMRSFARLANLKMSPPVVTLVKSHYIMSNEGDIGQSPCGSTNFITNYYNIKCTVTPKKLVL